MISRADHRSGQVNARIERIYWLAMLVMGSLAVGVVWFSPQELTLGAGIRSVYLHVAFVWAGLTGIGLAALVGAELLLGLNPRLSVWLASVGLVGLAIFAAGLGVSVLAAWSNWGGIFLAEPRLAASLRLLSLGVIVQVVQGWLLPVRMKGLMWALVSGYAIWTTAVTPLVLHPGNPIREAASGLQWTFFTLYGLCLLGGGLTVWRLRKSERLERWAS